ncbi:MAG: 50S ribosomal protein L11 [Candidatus Altiarchaeota archaeon]
MAEQTIEVLVDGGNANPGPPLGPALGPMGVNTAQVVKAINEKTKGYAGMKVPVKVKVDTSTKSFEVTVGSPPTSALIKKEIGLEKGTKDGQPVGDITLEKVIGIAKLKRDSLLAKDLKAATKEIVGVCKTLGVTVDGKSPKEVTAAIAKGEYDTSFKN